MKSSRAKTSFFTFSPNLVNKYVFRFSRYSLEGLDNFNENVS